MKIWCQVQLKPKNTGQFYVRVQLLLSIWHTAALGDSKVPLLGTWKLYVIYMNTGSHSKLKVPKTGGSSLVLSLTPELLFGKSLRPLWKFAETNQQLFHCAAYPVSLCKVMPRWPSGIHGHGLMYGELKSLLQTQQKHVAGSNFQSNALVIILSLSSLCLPGYLTEDAHSSALIIHECVWARARAQAHYTLWRQKTTLRGSVLFLPHEVHGLNLGFQAWQQVRLPTEPSRQPNICFWDSSSLHSLGWL